MKPKDVKRLLFSEIEATSENYADYVNNAKTDFKRNRKLSFSTIIKAIIGMESKSLTNEMKKLFVTDRNHYKLIPHSTPFDYLPLKLKKHEDAQFFELYFRIVRFKVNENLYETVLTNLNKNNYTPEKLKELYNSRWGIETSFRDLKYTIEMLAFHSKKVMCIHQEIYAHLIMYNFAEMITSHVIIEKKQRKYTYKANFSVALHVCRQFFRGKTTSPNLETIIERNTIPIRTGRHRERNLTVKVFHGFLYRVA